MLVNLVTILRKLTVMVMFPSTLKPILFLYLPLVKTVGLQANTDDLPGHGHWRGVLYQLDKGAVPGCANHSDWPRTE